MWITPEEDTFVVIPESAVISFDWFVCLSPFHAFHFSFFFFNLKGKNL